MTEYERLVRQGKHDNLSYSDYMLLYDGINDIINGKEELNNELVKILKGFFIDIEHVFRNEPRKYEKFKQIIMNYEKGEKL